MSHPDISIYVFCALPLHAAGPWVQDGDTMTCTGEQMNGIEIHDNALTTLNVLDLDPNLIQPAGAGVSGISFKNTGGGNITINSGDSQFPVVITTVADQSSGIATLSQRSPPAAPNDPFLNIPIPGTPEVSGGVVKVISFSEITTSGRNSHGIIAQSNTTGYHDSVVSSLENFSAEGIAFEVISVKNPDGSEGVIGSQIQGRILEVDEDGLFVGYGDEAGTFTLATNGSCTFNAGTAFDDLAVDESRTVSVNYLLDGYRNNELKREDINAELFATVTRTDSGLETVTEAYFDDYGESTKPQTEQLALPDLDSYVTGLINVADEAGGAGNSVSVVNQGSIATSGAASHGIFAESKGKPGTSGRNGDGFWSFGSRKPTAGSDGNSGGNISVTAEGSGSTYGTAMRTGNFWGRPAL